MHYRASLRHYGYCTSSSGILVVFATLFLEPVLEIPVSIVSSLAATHSTLSVCQTFLREHLLQELCASSLCITITFRLFNWMTKIVCKYFFDCYFYAMPMPVIIILKNRIVFYFSLINSLKYSILK